MQSWPSFARIRGQRLLVLPVRLDAVGPWLLLIARSGSRGATRPLTTESTVRCQRIWSFDPGRSANSALARESTMKAIVQTRYGSPDVLQLTDVDKPVVKDDEVLVRVHAAAVNIGDWHLLRGVPYVMRLVAGLRRPRREIPGLDIAGQVEAVGRNVRQFRPGDEVFGWCKGAFAECACAAESDLLPKPANLTSEQSAAVGDSAFTALAAVRDQGKVQPGDKVLINGASGGVGTFAVQIAKSFGANVTGVCSTRNLDTVRSLGADEVIDYTREDFAQTGQRYDVMLDLVGTRSLSDCRRALTPRGTYVVVGVKDMGRWLGLGRQVKALLLSPFVRQRMRVFVVRHSREDLVVLKELVEAGKIAPVIDRRFALSDVPDALRYQGEGHARGKIVIAV
jgi:NADPH:quinone reductase-like Zn-dependent oxidoreductase